MNKLYKIFKKAFQILAIPFVLLFSAIIGMVVITCFYIQAVVFGDTPDAYPGETELDYDLD